MRSAEDASGDANTVSDGCTDTDVSIPDGYSKTTADQYTQASYADTDEEATCV